MANTLPHSFVNETSSHNNIIAEAVEGIVRRYAIEMEAIGSDKYYIRRLCSVLPKVELRRSAQVFKIIAAREIFQRKPTMKRELRGGEF